LTPHLARNNENIQGNPCLSNGVQPWDRPVSWFTFRTEPLERKAGPADDHIVEDFFTVDCACGDNILAQISSWLVSMIAALLSAHPIEPIRLSSLLACRLQAKPFNAVVRQRDAGSAGLRIEGINTLADRVRLSFP
jgi:hypothetical protein